MTIKGLIGYGLAVFVSAFSIGACDSTATVNTNANVRNANSNTAIVVNATVSPTPRSTNMNANISREDYDKNRADYERDKGSSTIGQGVNDSWLWFKTRAALAAADDLRDSTINVDVVNDKITLRGTVASAAQKASAERVAKTIEGQKGVTNQLTVSADGSSTNANANARNSNSR